MRGKKSISETVGSIASLLFSAIYGDFKAAGMSIGNLKWSGRNLLIQLGQEPRPCNPSCSANEHLQILALQPSTGNQKCKQ